MANDDQYVNRMVTDGLTQANVSAIGNSSALSVAQTSLALAQSQSVLFAHMVNGYVAGGAVGALNSARDRREDEEAKTLAVQAEQTRAIEDLRDLMKDFIAAHKNDLACY